ncbi:hypothetical protein PspLS_10131 [Pyricularia sp. CBS 133598]|nr:hypothetical protein PspLS_10131 [Pyricularia sp. CBS 133598]
MTTAPKQRQDRKKLLQELTGLQIYFILLSVVIGSGVFNNNGEVLLLAGPMGLLLAVSLFDVVAMFVGETVSEFLQLSPVPNAIFFEFVDMIYRSRRGVGCRGDVLAHVVVHPPHSGDWGWKAA